MHNRNEKRRLVANNRPAKKGGYNVVMEYDKAKELYDEIKQQYDGRYTMIRIIEYSPGDFGIEIQ